VRDAHVGGEADGVVARALDLPLQGRGRRVALRGPQPELRQLLHEREVGDVAGVVRAEARPEDRVGQQPRLGEVGPRARDALELDAQLAVVLQRDRHGLPHGERRAAVPARRVVGPGRVPARRPAAALGDEVGGLPQVVRGIDVGRDAAGEAGREEADRPASEGRSEALERPHGATTPPGATGPRTGRRRARFSIR
jgi:hypothetical protein